MKKKAACYCRVSTKREEQEMSLENQMKFFETYTEQNNIELYHLYKDDGISAKSMKKRDNFNRMVRDAKKGMFSVILVKDISRFARNTLDFLTVIRELKSINIEVKFITANMTTYDSELMLTMLAAVAQEESANLSKRVKFAKQQSAKEGRVPRIIYGYDKIPKDRFGLTINEAEAKIVNRIYSLYANEQMGVDRIARLLNEEGIPTKKGGAYKWSRAVIGNMISNPIYAGQVCNGKSEVLNFLTEERIKYDESEWIRVDRPDLRIVSDELFNRANAIRLSRSNAFGQFEYDGDIKKKRPSIKYPLSNLLRCANDQYTFQRRVKRYAATGYENIYWICLKHLERASECSNLMKVNEEQMENAIFNFIMQLFSNQDIIRERLKSRVSQELQNRYDNEYSAKELSAELKKLQAQRDKLMDLYLDDDFDKQVLKDKFLPIDKQISEVNTRIAVYHEQDHVVQDIEKCLDDILSSIDSNQSNLLDNVFLKNIFEKFVVYPDGKIVAYIKLNQDTGETIEIPFCEMWNDEEISGLNCTHDKCGTHRPRSCRHHFCTRFGNRCNRYASHIDTYCTASSRRHHYSHI